jgi:ubiquinone/menaquinone biosynthesis C-methylase UbiE
MRLDVCCKETVREYDSRRVEGHQKEFDRIYAELGAGTQPIAFPLEEIEQFEWNRGPYGNRVYSYFYRRFTVATLGLLQVKDAQRILNIGCGFGFEEKNLAHLYQDLEMWSLDISPEMVSRAIENECPSHLCLSLAEALPFPDQSFDRILAREVIEHVLSARSMIKEMERCLKPGGLAVVTTEFESSLALSHFYATVFSRKWAGFLAYPLPEAAYKNRPPTLAELEELAHASGLEMEQVIWDGPLYQLCVSSLFQNLFKSGIHRIACFFSRLENKGTPDRYFCDQIKLALRKPLAGGKGESSSQPMAYRCPRCHAKLEDDPSGKKCVSCGRFFPTSKEGVPNFILYDFTSAEKMDDPGVSRKNIKEHRNDISMRVRKTVFHCGNLVVRTLYLLVILVGALLLVFYKAVSNKPRLQTLLHLDPQLMSYLEFSQGTLRGKKKSVRS